MLPHLIFLLLIVVILGVKVKIIIESVSAKLECPLLAQLGCPLLGFAQ